MPLPSLQAGGPRIVTPVTGMPSAIQNYQAPHYSPPAATPAASVLPPRQTGRSYAAQEPRSWKSWPMLVIVLASIAIVVAVVMMVWPSKEADAGRHVVQPPAPERMETDPLPPPGAGNKNGADPWGGHSQADPAPATPRQTPDTVPNTPTPPNAAQPSDPNDPFADPLAGMGNLAMGSPALSMMKAQLVHACTRMKSCPNADDTLTQLCDTVAMMPGGAPPTCDASKRCLEQIDKMDCSTDLDSANLLGLANQFQDCIKATTSC